MIITIKVIYIIMIIKMKKLFEQYQKKAITCELVLPPSSTIDLYGLMNDLITL